MYICREINDGYGGDYGPLFYCIMETERLNNAIKAALEANNAYLVDTEIQEGNRITVFVDADGGIKISQLKQINREIEGLLDREAEDFALTVSSPGLERPLKVHRQYVNNVGRWLLVKDKTGTQVEGKLIAVNDQEITLEIPAKKKKEAPAVQNIALVDIDETKIQVRF